MDRQDPPPTDEGWFALHDFRVIDWDAWREADESERESVIADGEAHLRNSEAVADADEGVSVTYAIIGHKADLLLLHLRPTVEQLDALERRFERTALAGVTERTDSFVSVTEVSGYTNPEAFEQDSEKDAGLRNYFESRLHPTIPEAKYVSFYPMNKRREPEYNWYDLPFEERAEHMANHGEIGREYAGEVTQIITGSIGYDDWEWGVTLFSNDPTAFKSLLYEMRFDPSTSRYAEFGQFYTGRRLDPEELGSYLTGEADTGAEEDPVEGSAGESVTAPGGPGTEAVNSPASADSSIQEALEDLDIYAGQPHGEDLYTMVMYFETDPETLFESVTDLRENFDHYDTHIKTAVYESADRTAVVSLWETQDAAITAGGFLTELPGVVSKAGETGGFETMGLFYQVKPDRRSEFVETFDSVREIVAEMNGHRQTELFTNHEDATDMFIASEWAAKEDAMAFFRSDEFADTVSWGREVLTDRPRHVFLA